MLEFLLLLVGSYLVGAIPFGLLIGWTRGIDIRQHGSGNIGATNAGRVLGRKLGWLCLTLDLLKGAVPTFIAGQTLVHHGAATAGQLWMWMLVAAAAVIGHNFPIYLGFRGGKGVSTTIGVALAIYPYFTVGMVVALLAYAALRYGAGYVSLGSIGLAVAFPLGVMGYLAIRGLSLSEHWPLPTVAAALGAMIILRHRGNIARLTRGEELKIGAGSS